MLHTCSHTVRSYELDGNRHVNNATYLNFLEYGRVTFLNDIGFDYQRLVSQGYALYLTRICIDYKAPATLGDVLIIKTVPVKKKLTSGVFRQIIECEGSTVVEAEVYWVCVDNKGKPSRLPKEFNLPSLEPVKPHT